MSKLSALKPQFGGSRGGNTPTENVAFQVVSYNIENTKKPEASPNDSMVVRLVHDVQGGKAKAGDTVTLKYNAPRDDNKNRPAMLEYQRGKGQAKAMGEGAIGIAGRAYIDDKTGELVCNWLDRWFPEVNPNGKQIHFPLPNTLASVRPEFDAGREGEERRAQNRYVVNTDGAVVFKGLEGLREAVASVIDGMEGTPGKHGVIIRIAEIDEPGALSTEVFQGWDTETETNRSGLDTIDYWLENNAVAKEWKEVLEGADEGLVFEVIPTLRFGTGSMSLPSVQIADRERDGKVLSDNQKIRFDDSMRYRVPGEDGERDDYGYALSHVKVLRVNDDADTPWFSSGTTPIAASYPLLYKREELLTPNLPANVAARFQAAAEARRDAARSARSSNNASNAPANEESNETPSRSM